MTPPLPRHVSSSSSLHCLQPFAADEVVQYCSVLSFPQQRPAHTRMEQSRSHSKSIRSTFSAQTERRTSFVSGFQHRTAPPPPPSDLALTVRHSPPHVIKSHTEKGACPSASSVCSSPKDALLVQVAAPRERLSCPLAKGLDLVRQRVVGARAQRSAERDGPRAL